VLKELDVLICPNLTRVRRVGANEKHQLNLQEVAHCLLLQVDKKWLFLPRGAAPTRQGKVCKAFVWWFNSIPRRHSSTIARFAHGAPSSSVE
jgi:hypothetical protein